MVQAALRNHMPRVLNHLAAGNQRRDRRMLLEVLEHLVNRRSTMVHRRFDPCNQANGDGRLVRIGKTASECPLCRISREQPRCSLFI